MNRINRKLKDTKYKTPGCSRSRATKLNDLRQLRKSASGKDYLASLLTPETIELTSIFPNPFNSMTQISYSLNENVQTNVSVFNSKGQQIETLFNGENETGSYTLNWNADGFGSGVYFIRLNTPNVVQTEKVTLVR